MGGLPSPSLYGLAMKLMLGDKSLQWIGATFDPRIVRENAKSAMSLLLSNWPLHWRWTRQLRDTCKTWLWVTRTWAAIVLALAIPAALARERPPENRSAPPPSASGPVRTRGWRFGGAAAAAPCI